MTVFLLLSAAAPAQVIAGGAVLLPCRELGKTHSVQLLAQRLPLIGGERGSGKAGIAAVEAKEPHRFSQCAWKPKG